MKLAILALAICACVASAVDISKRDGYLYQHRRRLGHFKDQPFIDLYKTYAASFVSPLHPDRKHDDFRSFTPSADECINYLQEFKINKYKEERLDKFVLLDACLGYLYESEHHEQDMAENDMVAQRLGSFIDDITLRTLYEGTQIDELQDDAKDCIADLMMSSIIMREQFKDQRCNSHFIQMYIQFAECHHDIPTKLRHTDTYIEPLYDIVRDETQSCFDEEKHALESAVREYYKKAYSTRLKNNVLRRFYSSLRKQQDERMWPSPILRLLQAITDVNNQVSLRDVHQLLRGYYMSDQKLTNKLLTNIANYAQRTIKPKSKDKGGDPHGTERYQDNVVDKLCDFFRSSDDEHEFDFATSFIRLIRILQHEDVFEISFNNFITKVLTQAEETSAMYLSISACNILTFTEGRIVIPRSGKSVHYIVQMKPDTTGMVRWPDAGYY